MFYTARCTKYGTANETFKLWAEKVLIFIECKG